MVRITTTPQPDGAIRLCFEGWFSQGEVAFLTGEVGPWFQLKVPLVLNLDGIQFIDEEGIEMLKSWLQQGAILQGGTLFIRTLLRRHGLE